jgi:glutathione peroxidase
MTTSLGGLVFALILTLSAPAQAAADTCPALLDKTVLTLLDEAPVSLCDYRGKVLLVVNTASFCGFTPQYTGLEQLQREYAGRGLVVLGFPSNDFGEQEPGNAKQIKELCVGTYGVKFPMFSKTRVTGPQAAPLYQDLTRRAGRAPQWNFHKYLVDRKGAEVRSFDSDIKPTDPAFRRQIEALLAQR